MIPGGYSFIWAMYYPTQCLWDCGNAALPSPPPPPLFLCPSMHFSEHVRSDLVIVACLLFVSSVFSVCNTSNFLDFENSFILKLSQRIQLRSSAQMENSQGNSPQDDASYFHKTFPFFIWLLRDVVLSLPKDCSNIKDYFLTRVSQLLGRI